MQTLSGLKKLSGIFGILTSLVIAPAFAQHAGDNWTYGEDLNAGQLLLGYKIGASTPAQILCHREIDTIILELLLPSQNITPGQLVNVQVVMDTKPYQLSTDKTFEKDGMLLARFLLPTNGDFMNNAIASTQIQFGIPGQQYQTVYFPPSKETFANFNGKCAWMQNEAKGQTSQQAQQTQTANTGTQGQQPVSWKLHPGTGRNAQFHITNPNDGNKVVMFCTPQNPDIIHAYIKHGKAYTEQRQITLNSAGNLYFKMRHTITGTTTENGIYLALKHDDPHWGIIGNSPTYSVNGVQIASFPINLDKRGYFDELGEFLRQCGTTQAHRDSLSAAIKPHADKARKAAQNGQEAFIDLNAVSVGQSQNPQASAQQQQVQQAQRGSTDGENTLQNGLNTLGQVVQLGQQIVELKNQLQGDNGDANQQQQVQQQQQPQQQLVQQAPASQQTNYSNLANYRCENGAQFQVRYEGGNNFDRAVLIMNGIAPVSLPSVQAGSGAKYFNGSIEWHTKGPDGILSQGGQELVCEEQ